MSKKWLDLVKLLAPIIIPIVAPSAAPAVPFIVHGIEKAETLTGTGAEKLAIAREITNAGLHAANAIHPGAIDAAGVNAALDHGISTTVAIANLVHRTTPESPPQ